MPKRNSSGRRGRATRNDKTVVVKVERRFTQTLLKKTVRRTKNPCPRRGEGARSATWGLDRRDQADLAPQALDRRGRGGEGLGPSTLSLGTPKLPRRKSGACSNRSERRLDPDSNADQPRRRGQFGARRVMCIKVLGGSKRKHAPASATSSSCPSKAIPRGRVKKGDVMKARSSFAPPKDIKRARRFGDPFRHQRRRAHQQPGRADRHPRIFGPVPRELRAKNHMKIISLAPEVL